MINGHCTHALLRLVELWKSLGFLGRRRVPLEGERRAAIRMLEFANKRPGSRRLPTDTLVAVEFQLSNSNPEPVSPDTSPMPTNVRRRANSYRAVDGIVAPSGARR